MATKDYKQEIQEKLQDPILRRNLGNFADAYLESRRKAYEGKDVPYLRECVKAAKEKAVNNLEEMGEKFARAAEGRGAVVYRAKDAEAANQYINDLALAKGITKIIKSKSMASEETHLNHFLEGKGLRPVETDLGEWIIQMAGQKPSHMVMPAIHMSRQQVAGLFSKELERDVPVDISEMVRIARNELRKNFEEAEMGISGGNIAVAETGSFFLVANEGNERLVTHMPKVHVTIIGYEKLVPTFLDAVPIIESLPRSATGQKITSYVTAVTGPRPEGELHIILLDNGRLEMAKDPVFKQTFQCIRCGSCLNVCPVYQMVGGHVYGHIYSGGIGVILTSFFHSSEEADKLQELCIACGRCKEVCPGKVPVTDLIVEVRDRMFKKRPLATPYRIAFNNVMSSRKMFHGILRAASKLQKPFTKGEPMIRHLPLFFSDMVKFRNIPAIADKPLRDQVKEYKQTVTNPKGKIAYFSGCSTDFMFPSIGMDVIKVLNHHGYEVVFPQEQSCCGVPARYMGDIPNAKKLAKENITAFEAAGADYNLVSCASCAGALKHDYEKLFADEPEWLFKAKVMADKLEEFTSFVYNCSKEEDQTKSKVRPLPSFKVTYHDSCHLKRNHGIFEEPRQLLKGIQGAKFVEMAYPDRCCGCGGTFSLKFPELSEPILEKKLQTIEESGADVLATACPGCLMQIKGGLDKKGSKVQAYHVAELLARQLEQ